MSSNVEVARNGHGDLVEVVGTVELHAEPPKSGRSLVRALVGGALAGSDKLDLGSETSRQRFAKSLAGVLIEKDVAGRPDFDALARALLALAEKQYRDGSAAGTEPDPAEEAQRVKEVEEKAKQKAQEALQTANGLLDCPALLWHLADHLVALGLAGERRNAQVLYLAFTGRVQDHINSVVVKGPSSAGKNTLIQRVLNLFPSSVYYDTTGLSEHGLIYTNEPFQHRYIVIDEAPALERDSYLTLLVRCLLSEGRIRYNTVERIPEEEGGGVQGLVIEKEGPTGLITTTTRAHLFEDLENRLLSITVRDDRIQTRAVLKAIAQRRAGKWQAVDSNPWVAAQEWIDLAGAHEAIIPFAPALADLIPVSAVRIRRDFPQLLDLIGACAILHQRQRTVADGQVTATLADYAAVRGIMADAWQAVQQDGLTFAQREAVEAVTRLYEQTNATVTYKLVATELELDRSAVVRRLANPLFLGYVTNEEERKGHQAKFKPGTPLPDLASPLPTVAELAEKSDLPALDCDPASANSKPPVCTCGLSFLEFDL